MKKLETIYTIFKLKRAVRKIVKSEVNPSLNTQTVYTEINNLKLKIESERVCFPELKFNFKTLSYTETGNLDFVQRINVYLDNSKKTRLAYLYGRRSNKRLSGGLDKESIDLWEQTLNEISPMQDLGWLSILKKKATAS